MRLSLIITLGPSPKRTMKLVERRMHLPSGRSSRYLTHMFEMFQYSLVMHLLVLLGQDLTREPLTYGVLLNFFPLVFSWPVITFGGFL